MTIPEMNEAALLRQTCVIQRAQMRCQFIVKALCLSLLLTIITIVLYRIGLVHPQIAHENHAMEWVQVLALGVATIVGCKRALDLPSPPHRFMAVFVPALAVSVLLRELELAKLNVPQAVKFIDIASGYLTLAVWTPLLFVFGIRHRRLMPVAMCLLRSWAGAFSSLAVLLYVLGWPSDRLHWSFTGMKAEFLEELLETHASLCFVLAGFSLKLFRAPDACHATANGDDASNLSPG